MGFDHFTTLTPISPIPDMSPKEMRARSDECERLADSLELTPGDLREMLREVAAQWRRLADDAEAHPKPPKPPCSGTRVHPNSQIDPILND